MAAKSKVTWVDFDEKPVSSESEGSVFIESPAVHQDPPIPVSDGYRPGLIDLGAALRRVAAAYKGRNAFFVNPSKADSLLRTALRDVPLTDENVIQLWLSVGYFWKSDLNGGPNRRGTDVLPESARWVLCSICTYLNSRRLGVRSPKTFSPLDGAAFRS